MKVVWIAVNASHAHASLALPLVERACSGVSGLAWEAVQTTAHDDPAAVAAAAAACHPDVVAATLYLFNRRLVLDALARLKARSPGCVTVVGGPECLGENRSLLQRHPWVDLAVRGEGEAVMPDLLHCLERGQEPAGLPGVCWRDGAGVLHDDGTRAVVADWAAAPPPSRSPFFAVDRPFVQLETSRGCRGRCIYCTSCGSLPVRRRGLGAIREELSELHERGVREVRVLDRTFNDPPGEAAELLGLFLHTFAGMRFHLEMEPARLTDELRAILRNAPPGTLHIEAGLQSTSPRALAASGRASDPAQALDGLRFLVRETTVPTHVDLLAGLPGQTLADIERDVEALLAIGPDEIQLELLKVLPGTPLRDSAAALGVCYSPVVPYEVLGTRDCQPDALRTAAGWSRVLDSFYNAPALRGVFRALVAGQGSFVSFAEGCAEPGLTRGPAALERRFRHVAKVCAAGPGTWMDRVRLAWIEAGLSPADPLAGASPWKAAVPHDAVWTRGEEYGATAGVARVWHLILSDREAWCVYDRRRAGREPAGIAVRARVGAGGDARCC